MSLTTASEISVLLSDVDGVMTDGRITFDQQGAEIKSFHIRDGLGIRLWQQAGYQFGIVTGRSSVNVQRRARELGINIVRQGSDDKLGQTRRVARQLGLNLERICYIGDDLPDLAAIRAVGLGVAVADAADEVRAAADLVTATAGGYGVVREVIETLLKQKGEWNAVLEPYTTNPDT